MVQAGWRCWCTLMERGTGSSNNSSSTVVPTVAQCSRHCSLLLVGALDASDAGKKVASCSVRMHTTQWLMWIVDKP